ncbi:metallophosphoesterase [Polymorphobacter multimanifer]|uniref:metallophosphoesterase family protein n=1 Tax=Polymorphobacter multimanifer TaxID=1070431 RepID=UPI00166A1BBA|nr:metallophosphoesterase [Polymorphobacter multimanifer]GGI74834.1 metallophosphoesterase [Polymorphobacter multimanifer]
MTRIFHVSDVHFGTEDRDALAWFAAEVKAASPDLVLVTGDLTAAARTSEFAAAGDWLAGLAAPVRIEPGTHDLPVYNPVLRLTRPYARLARLVARVGRPAVLDDVSLVSLKTTARAQWRTNWSLGHVGRSALARTLAEVRAAPASRPIIAACHHPLVDMGTRTKGSTRGGAAALAALAEAGVTAVVSGHTHDPFDRMWPHGDGAVRLIGAGTLSERVRETMPSYNRITVVDGEIDNFVVSHGEGSGR